VVGGKVKCGVTRKRIVSNWGQTTISASSLGADPRYGQVPSSGDGLLNSPPRSTSDDSLANFPIGRRLKIKKHRLTIGLESRRARTVFAEFRLGAEYCIFGQAVGYIHPAARSQREVTKYANISRHLRVQSPI